VLRALACCACLFLLASEFAVAQKQGASPPAKAVAINFRGMDYVHRWSREGQNEFTPESDADLARWHDMVTINVPPNVGNGDQLAELANRVLTSYQNHGKILRTDSKPRTPQRTAEHVIVAVLGNPAFLEAAFARFLLVDGKGLVVVYSHRIYGQNAGPAMSEWLRANGATSETALMEWRGYPSAAALRTLPQAK
jgi:hypothetical protein